LRSRTATQKRNQAKEIEPRDILKASAKSNHARIEARELPDLLRKIEIYQGTHVTAAFICSNS